MSTPDIGGARQFVARRRKLNNESCRVHAWVGTSFFFNNDYTLLTCALCGDSRTEDGNRLNVNPFAWATEQPR